MSILSSAAATAVVPVSDIDVARSWWVDTLGLRAVHVSDKDLVLEAGNGTRVLCYVSDGAGVAPNSVIDFQVTDIEVAADDLIGRGVTLERYDGLEADGRGIADMGAMRCAWITDPDGNSIAISQPVAVMA